MPNLPDYGIDAPTIVRNNAVGGLLALGAGATVFAVFRGPHPDLAASIFLNSGIACVLLLAVAGIMVWSSKVGKFRVRDKLLSAITWRGDQQVMDIGCGRGLALLGAAKWIPAGHAIGIDLWSNIDLSANSAGATMANAKAEGVADRITLQTGDARLLPLPDAIFDVIVCMTVLHNIKARAGREQALSEAVRVLKPGGKIAIFDIFHAGQYRKCLASHGLYDVSVSGLYLLWMIPRRIVTATKPNV